MDSLSSGPSDMYCTSALTIKEKNASINQNGCYTAETNTTLKINYTPIQIKKKQKGNRQLAVLKPGRAENIQIKDDFERGKGQNPITTNHFTY